MTLLHVYFTLHDQQAFQRLLERDRTASAGPQTAQSASAGKSWTRRNIASALELNALDHLGRTALHLVCSSTEPASLEYARLLLAHPSINVNIPDKENHWTALHRALYVGNIEAAVLLLKRTDTDTSMKDMEGYTAFDLYNSTVQSAHPTPGHATLLTWGVNRNATLGTGDSNDRTHPDHVVLFKKDAPLPKERTLEDRFKPVRAKSVAMSKLHTVILTDESRDNIRLCGFGSGGRLGPFSHTLYTPTPLALSSNSIVSVAMGQDHTLALTSAGEVISWGLNRFAQLGYVVESVQGGSLDESIQTTPRKIGHLRREAIKGVAACKNASACWSDDDVWTWGTNVGQLGYSKTASPVQILPRKASIITQPIRGIVLSETAMLCLFLTGDVVCVWNGGISKINFPAHAFPSDISTIYRPPQATRAPLITKLALCDDLFAALSSNGEVFTFSLPIGDAEGNLPGTHVGGNRGQVKPQRAWALRRQFSSVRDVDIGGDGALIVCTQSGHVFVRSRNLKGATTSTGTKAFKFQRIAHVQRAVSVCANSTGSFGALCVDYNPSLIDVTGRDFSADMAGIVPYIVDNPKTLAHQATHIPLDQILGTEDDLEDSLILDDVAELTKLMVVLCNWGNQATPRGVHGADLLVRIGGDFDVPAHRVILAARCKPLRDVLGGRGLLRGKSSGISVTLSMSSLVPLLHFAGITPLSALLLLHYLYTDKILAVWDRRIESLFEAQFAGLGLSATRVKADLATLAQLLHLPHLASALQYVGKHIPKSSASDDFQWLFDQAHFAGPSTARRNVYQDPLAPDVALHLADKTIYTHSVVLRARSAFFTAFFNDPDWTMFRRDDAGVVDVEMRHHKWQVMQFVLSFLCFGEEKMFETLEFIDNVDELIEFMFLVISAANELLLTRLVLLCSRVVLKYLNVYNACYLLTDAIHFNAVDLADRIQSYMTANLEQLLESRIIDDLDSRVVRKLSEHTRADQAKLSPISRSNKLGQAALEKHREWLALQDIPTPIIPSQRLCSGKDSPKMSPPGSAKMAGRPSKLYSPTTSPFLRPSVSPQPPQGDDIFTMDDADVESSVKPNAVQASRCEEIVVPVPVVATARPGWKSHPTTPRTDLKSIIAEAENNKRQVHARPLDSPGPSVRLGVTSANTTSAPVTSTSLRHRGYTSGPHSRSDTPSTPPRRVPSESALPSKLEPPPTPTPTRTSVAARTTPAVQANSGSSRPGMGPVIIPVRQTASASGSTGGGSRKPSLGGAWTLPPVQPIAEPTVSGPMLSFSEIQRMQELQGSTPVKDKRSLREIQEEERARQQEADFLKWWAAEEERVRLEMSEREPGRRGGKTRTRKPRGGVVQQGRPREREERR